MQRIFTHKTHAIETQRKYPWDKMEKGDEFVFPKEVSVKSARMSARKASERYGANFIVVRRKDDVICRRVDSHYISALPRGRIPKYPWETMKIGESFIMDTDNYKSARARAGEMSRKLNRKFRAKEITGAIKIKRVK